MLHLIDLHGTSWKAIARSFSSRSISSIRNRYQRIINGSKQGGKNKCHTCGMVKRGHVCGGGVRRSSVGGVLSLSPVTDTPPSPPWVSSDVRLEWNDDGEMYEDEEVEGPYQLFSWHTVQTAHDMGFDDVTHPPPLVQGFPFATSLP